MRVAQPLVGYIHLTLTAFPVVQPDEYHIALPLLLL